MRKAGFLTAEELQVLGELARNGLCEHRLARRANALILLDRGMSYRQVATVLLLDDETVRGWRRLFEADGVAGLVGFYLPTLTNVVSQYGFPPEACPGVEPGLTTSISSSAASCRASEADSVPPPPRQDA